MIHEGLIGVFAPETFLLPGGSLFRSGRPAFFCTETPWPAIGADLSPMVGQLPALQRLQDMRAGRPHRACGG